MRISALLLFSMSIFVSLVSAAETGLQPTQLDDLDYKPPLLSGNYDPAIPTPSAILGFELGIKTASPSQIVDVITTLSGQSERAILVEYARSHENRPLYYVVISSPDNLARIDAIKADLARLSDPRGLSDAQAEALIDGLPAVAWMAYSIHGNETSGADSALASIYHLLASTDEDVRSLLEKSIVIIDPSMNPDGRARFFKKVEEVRSVAPNVDNQSMLHTQDWPGGRYNHYLFDLNRDFIHGIHPETRGRVRAINEWRPQIVIDGHEMGSQDTYHFSPAREPVNVHKAPSLDKWNEVFGEDMAQAFDSKGWPYFNGEYYDDLYPGYTTYSQYRGAVNILYEQARLAEDGVRHPQGTITTYQEAVHHQLTSTLTNLETLAARSGEMYRDYLADRRFVMSSSSPYAARNFVILPTQNRSRLQRFIDTMALQGFEMFTASRDIQVSDALTQSGETRSRATIPAGSLVIPNRQPEARLVATMLEFETTIRESTLLKERQSILRGEGSIMYDVTAWNITMLHGLEAWTVNGNLGSDLDPFSSRSHAAGLDDVAASLGFVINGSDDHSVSFAARAMELGINVRVIDIPTELDGRDWPRGSVVVSRNDNRAWNGDLAETVRSLAEELGLVAQGFAGGTGPGDLPDFGGRHFRLLEAPRIAIVVHGGLNPLDVGAIWNSIDSFLGIRHSQLNWEWLESFDLRRYNVLVIPDARTAEFSDEALANLKNWVENGGTLIAVKRSAAALSEAAREFTTVRQIADTFGEQGKYDLALQREWLAGQDSLGDRQQLWARVAPEEVSYPWVAGTKEASKDDLKRLDDWQSLFVPQGAILAGNSNQKHWLSFGTDRVLPVLFGSGPILMSDSSTQAVVRFGVLNRMSQDRWRETQAANAENKKTRKVGWATLPDQYELNLRMSGLLWPEAAQRLANAAYLTRESKGNGQIILFADSPAFRGSTLGTNRLLLNALVYGPGLGARHPIVP